MRNYSLNKISVLILISLSSCTCNNKVPNKMTLKVPRELKNINFFLETSASMGGYLKGGAEFSHMIPNLLVDIENRIDSKNKTISINYISDSITKYQKTTRDFIHDISTSRVTDSKSSQMDRIFELVTSKTDSNDISIFVSDCILSYPDADIRKTPEINVTNAEGELKVLIKEAFLKIKNRNICASLYGFNSRFYGRYYTYKNGHIELNGNVKRPFYIWVIGDKELLQKFNNQLSGIESFKPELSIDFGLFEKPIVDYNILFKTERQGTSWIAGEKEISSIETSKSKTSKFAIAVDLSALPLYARDFGYLKSKLIVDFKEGVVGVVDVKNAGDLISKANPHEKEFLQNSSHVIILEVSDIYKPSGLLSLKLPLKYPTDYVSWSIMDDKSEALLDGKTFAFQHLVDGVREAYQNNNEYFINISITLKK